MQLTRLSVFVFLITAACGSSDREAQLRELIVDAELAAEARSTAVFRRLISEDFVGQSGRNSDQLIALIRGFFLINAEIEVINRIGQIEFDGEDFATVELQTAIIGNVTGGSLLEADADFYELTLEFASDGSDWLLIGAAWDRLFD